MSDLTRGVTVVLGGQWGDEGKGKLVDILAQEADIVARCQVRTKHLHTISCMASVCKVANHLHSRTFS